MKSINLLSIAVLAVAAVGCGGRGYQPVKQSAPSVTPSMVGDNGPAMIVNKAVEGFKGEYDQNSQANKELAAQIGGASMTLDPSVKDSPANITIVLKGTCETIKGEVRENQASGNLKTKCVGKDGSCDQVGVLLTHELNGKKGQVVFSFEKREDGNYFLSGWPGVAQAEVRTAEQVSCGGDEPRATWTDVPTEVRRDKAVDTSKPLYSDNE